MHCHTVQTIIWLANLTISKYRTLMDKSLSDFQSLPVFFCHRNTYEHRVEITNVSYFKVPGNNLKMHVAYFWRPRLYKIILGMAAGEYIPQKTAEIERIPAWIWSGHKVAYQLNFAEISKLGVISGVEHIPQLFFKNTMFFPISINQIIFSYNSRPVRLNHRSLVPTPCMEHSTCTHTAKVVARVGMGRECLLRYTCTLWKYVCQEMWGGGVFGLGGRLSRTLCCMIQNVFMFSSFDLLFCCRIATFHF